MPDVSLDRATAAIGELSANVRKFTTEVENSERLRTQKIRALYRLMYVVAPAVLLLLVLAITNFALLSKTRDAAADAKNTNDLLVGCFTPGTQCAELQKAQSDARINQIRQTQFVIAVCQRRNPVDEDPTATGMMACVQDYYPGFALPAKSVK